MAQTCIHHLCYPMTPTHPLLDPLLVGRPLMAPHPSICQTLRMTVVPMVSRRLQLHPAEALAGHIDPETPVVPSQSLRSPLSVEAIQVSSAAKDTKQKHKKHKEVEMQREKAEDESVSEMHKSIWIACNPSIREAEARGLLQV